MNFRKKKKEKITILSIVIIFVIIVFFTIKSLFSEQFQYTNNTAYVPAFVTNINYKEYSKTLSNKIYAGECSESIDLKGNNMLNVHVPNLNNYDLNITLNKNSSNIYGYLKNLKKNQYYAIYKVDKFIIHKQLEQIEASFSFKYLKNGVYTSKSINIKDALIQCKSNNPNMLTEPSIKPIPFAIKQAGIAPATFLVDSSTSVNISVYTNDGVSNNISSSVVQHNALGICKFYYANNGDYIFEYNVQSIFNNLNYDVKYIYTGGSSNPSPIATLDFKASLIDDSADIAARNFNNYKLSNYIDQKMTIIYQSPTSVYLDSYLLFLDQNNQYVAIYTTMLCVN